MYRGKYNTSNSDSSTNMKPCIHRVDVIDPDLFGCNNFDDLIHNGYVPRSVCTICPFAEEKSSNDFFTQTTKLLLKKQRTGEYRPQAKGCGGCSDVKRRYPDKPFDLQFVWPYWHGGANGDEMRFSVRSVERFFAGVSKCTIIGDKPPWFSGHCIPQKRVPKRTQARSYRDMLSKMWTMATHPEIDNDFIWMMDDIYFIKPFTLEQLQLPRAEKWRPSEYNTWQLLKNTTMSNLKEKGLPTIDYATHMPHYVDKERLKALFDEFNLHTETLLWEVLYGNRYNESYQRSRPFFVRIGTKLPVVELHNATRKSTVFNHTSGVWCEDTRKFLLELLPDMASIEIERETHPQIKQDIKRIVKRRPPETHRSYIEVAK